MWIEHFDEAGQGTLEIIIVDVILKKHCVIKQLKWNYLASVKKEKGKNHPPGTIKTFQSNQNIEHKV